MMSWLQIGHRSSGSILGSSIDEGSPFSAVVWGFEDEASGICVDEGMLDCFRLRLRTDGGISKGVESRFQALV